MKSGLEDRNNCACGGRRVGDVERVSMKSGLEDRNNDRRSRSRQPGLLVSMKSGLEDRNNGTPWPAEQQLLPPVSMKSGLEDRNNSLDAAEADIKQALSQ